MASVEDYNAPQTLDGMNYLRSIKNQREYDCKNAKVRQRSTIHYSGNMGQGDIIENFNYPNADWQRIVTRTLGDTLWKIACGKE